MLDDQVVGIPGLGPVKKQVPDIGTYVQARSGTQENAKVMNCVLAVQSVSG
jgi:hypothetical protein